MRRNALDVEEQAADLSVYEPGEEELRRVLAFLADKTSPFARIVPARVAFEAHDARRELL